MPSFLTANRRKVKRFTKFSLWVLLIIVLSFYLTFPILFRLSPKLQNHFIFQNDELFTFSTYFDLSSPEDEGLPNAINHYVQFDTGVVLGVWQVLPTTSPYPPPALPSNAEERRNFFLKRLSDGRDVFLYCHGNRPSRAATTRVQMYKLLAGLGHHVVAFDYRGFADSTNLAPSEEGLVEDTLSMVHWLKKRLNGKLYIWGHSLGTGVATEVAARMCSAGLCPDALFLQAPFTSIRDELDAVGKVTMFRVLPWFHWAFQSPLESQGIRFDSASSIQLVLCPILILHAQDDKVVPYKLGAKLFGIARAKDSSANVEFASFDSRFGYGHNELYRAPDLPLIVSNFLEDSNI